MKNISLSLSVKESKKQFAPLFTAASYAVSYILPALENILVENNGVLSFSATDLENWIRIEHDQQTKDEYAICVPSKKLAYMMSNSVDDVLKISSISQEDPHVKIENGGFVANMASATWMDYPKKPEIDPSRKSIKVEIDAVGFVPILKNAIKFASTDELRPAMCGVCLIDWRGCLHLVSTDAHVLYYKDIMKTPAGFENIKAIIPARGVRLLLQLITDKDKVKINIHNDESMIRFSSGRKSISSKLVDARYPDFPVVIPKLLPIVFYLKRRQLVSFLKLSAPFVNQSSKQITLLVSHEKIQIEGADVDFGFDIKYSVPIYNISGGMSDFDFKFAVNYKYLLLVLSTSSDEYSKIAHTGTSTSGFMIDDSVLMMPLRLNS